MGELRQLTGYAIGIVVLTAAAAFSLHAILLEAASYAGVRSGDLSISANASAAAADGLTRDANAQPVWIAPTPRYQYDPKLMELKPPHQLRKEAELRRQQEQAKYRAHQREAAQRQKQNVAATAREAFASVRSQTPATFLMFSPH